MSSRRRLITIAAIVAAVLIAVYLIGFVLFDLGGTDPGSGEGDPVTGLTTP